MPEPTNEDSAFKHPKMVFLTALTTGLETASTIFSNELAHKLITIFSPGIALLVYYFLKFKIKSIECKRGIKVYKELKEKKEKELLDTSLTPELREKIEQDIRKLDDDIEKLKKDTIKIIVE